MIKHLAIIMDGNRRWAKAKLLPSIMGHKVGADNVDKIVELAMNKGIKHLTLRGLSTENLLNRGDKEVDSIIKLVNSIEKYLGKMIKKGLKFEYIGDIAKLPEKTVKILDSIKEKTKDNTGITLTIALIYGGQDEIIRGIKKFINDGGDIENLDNETFRNYLDVSFLPKPDVIVRTGGDIRHSGFLLYDSAYSEYYFSQKYWPDFDEEELDKVINFFKDCKRNFGK